MAILESLIGALQAIPIIQKLIRAEVKSIVYLHPWDYEAEIDIGGRRAHTPAYVCVRVRNDGPGILYPKRVCLQYRPIAEFAFEDLGLDLEQRAKLPDEISRGSEAEMDFGTAAAEIASHLDSVTNDSTPLLRACVVDRMGRVYAGEPTKFDVEKWLGREMSEEEVERELRD